MKKGIIILTILILSITTYRVKALSLDGTRVSQYKTYNDDWKEMDFYWYENGGTDARNQIMNFNYNTLYTTRGDYVVFATKGYFKHWDGSTLNFNNVSTMYDNEFLQLDIFIQIVDSSGLGTRCEFQNNMIVCPIKKNTEYTKLEFETNIPNSQSDPISISDWFLSVYSYAEIYLSNTGQIIESQENQTQQQIESQTICSIIDNKYIEIQGKYLNGSGVETISNDNSFGITKYIPITENDKMSVADYAYGPGGSFLCFYNIKKEKISCTSQTLLQIGDIINIPNNTNYVRISIKTTINEPQYKICRNGNQALMDQDNNYNNNPSQDYTNETNATQNLQDAEDILMNNLDLNATQDMNITINPNASVFIWNVVDSLRTISTKIILLMTSLLSIGVIKLILNR